MRSSNTRSLPPLFALVVFLLFFLLVFVIPLSAHEQYIIWGHVRYSDGWPVPVGVPVYLYNPRTGEEHFVLTIENISGFTGYYIFTDILADMPETEGGDTLYLTVNYGGNCFNESVVLDKHLIYVPVWLSDNLPPFTPGEPVGPVSGVPGVLYNFSVSSWDPEGNNVFYNFSWGDGNFSGWLGFYGSNVSCVACYSWSGVGVFGVRVEAMDEFGALRGHYTKYGLLEWSSSLNITINTPPNANFTWNPTSPKPMQTIKFNSTSTDPDGTIVNYTWDFGDGNKSYEQNPYHIYNKAGIYQVTLTVKDNLGGKDTITKTITISKEKSSPQRKPPTADFTYTGGYTNETIIFNSTSHDPDGTIINYTWDFGDDNISYEENPRHMYTKPGSYTVTLTVTDNDQLSSTIQKTITITRRYNGKQVETIRLKYSKENIAHPGRNYIIWKGENITASMLIQQSGLSNGDTIAVFRNGEWHRYTAGSNNTGDFTIHTWDVVEIRCKAEKNITLEISKQNKKPMRINIRYIPYQQNNRGNHGYNYLPWMHNISITAYQLTKILGLTPTETIYKFDPSRNEWIPFNQALKDHLDNYMINQGDILCLKVNRDYTLDFEKILEEM